MSAGAGIDVEEFVDGRSCDKVQVELSSILGKVLAVANARAGEHVRK